MMNFNWETCPYCEWEQKNDTLRQLAEARNASERLKVIEQLKTDGLMNEEEYAAKRKEILGQL